MRQTSHVPHPDTTRSAMIFAENSSALKVARNRALTNLHTHVSYDIRTSASESTGNLDDLQSSYSQPLRGSFSCHALSKLDWKVNNLWFDNSAQVNRTNFSSESKQECLQMTRTESTVQFRTFTSYAQHHTAAKNMALGSIELNGVAAALERCRDLAEEICAKLRAKKPGSVDIRALAEFQVAIERAASVRLDMPQPTRRKADQPDF
jgi:hypothetical protein